MIRTFIVKQRSWPGWLKWLYKILYDDDDYVRFVLDQQTLNFDSDSSLIIQLSAGRHVAPLGRIIMISSQPVFTLIPLCSVSELARPGLEPTICKTWCEHANHYTNVTIGPWIRLFYTSLVLSNTNIQYNNIMKYCWNNTKNKGHTVVTVTTSNRKS
jgi:hypothetical protein